MNHHYQDIISRIPEPPKWWDESAVPRYCDFAPNEGANIYAHEIALVLIACQSCETEFQVAMSCDEYNVAIGKRIRLAELIALRTLHYGDPPNTKCCAPGPTMNCLDYRVLQYWRKNNQFEWERDAGYEVTLDDYPEAEEELHDVC